MRIARLLAVILALAALRAPAGTAADGEAELRRAFGAFIAAKVLRFDTVPDLYPGGTRASASTRKPRISAG